MKPLLKIMKDIAEKYNATIPQVAINWLLKYDDVFPIVGAKSIEQIETNIGAAKWKMSDEEWNRITSASDKIKLDLFFEFGYS